MENNSPITFTFNRLLTVSALMLFLGVYLRGVQMAYDIESSELLKLALFSLVIFGGGLSWDILKKIASLQDDQMQKFSLEFRNSILWMIGYVLFAVLVLQVVGPWAGLPTIGIGFYILISIYSLLKFFVSFENAIRVVNAN